MLNISFKLLQFTLYSLMFFGFGGRCPANSWRGGSLLGNHGIFQHELSRCHNHVCNKRNYVQYKLRDCVLSCLINFPSIQSDFKREPNDVTRYQLEYPAKKLEKGFTYFGNVFSTYLTTKTMKTMALLLHFKPLFFGYL